MEKFEIPAEWDDVPEPTQVEMHSDASTGGERVTIRYHDGTKFTYVAFHPKEISALWKEVKRFYSLPEPE